jgi:tetratricopeptide (TPR) repeat protein
VALLDDPDGGAAARELDAALAIDPLEPTALDARARLHLVGGEAAAAVALLRRAGAPAPAVRRLLAEALVRSGRPADASAVIEPELIADQATIDTYVVASWARIAAGELVRGAEIAEAGMRRWPDSEIASVYLTLPPPVLAERTVLRLRRLQERPEVSELVAVARVLIDVDPTRKTRGLAIARTLLEQAIGLAPRHVSAHHHLARVLRESDIEAALAAWTRALALAPADELALQIHTQMARARYAIADGTGAEAAFRDALAVNRRLRAHVPEPSLEYVRFLREEQRHGEADALLAEIAGWSPWSPAVRLERARQHELAGAWARVLAEGEFVLRSAGDNLELRRGAHLLLAKAYHRLEQPDRAREHAEWLRTH